MGLEIKKLFASIIVNVNMMDVNCKNAAILIGKEKKYLTYSLMKYGNPNK